MKSLVLESLLQVQREQVFLELRTGVGAGKGASISAVYAPVLALFEGIS